MGRSTPRRAGTLVRTGRGQVRIDDSGQAVADFVQTEGPGIYSGPEDKIPGIALTMYRSMREHAGWGPQGTCPPGSHKPGDG